MSTRWGTIPGLVFTFFSYRTARFQGDAHGRFFQRGQGQHMSTDYNSHAEAASADSEARISVFGELSA